MPATSKAASSRASVRVVAGRTASTLTPANYRRCRFTGVVTPLDATSSAVGVSST